MYQNVVAFYELINYSHSEVKPIIKILLELSSIKLTMQVRKILQNLLSKLQ